MSKRHRTTYMFTVEEDVPNSMPLRESQHRTFKSAVEAMVTFLDESQMDLSAITLTVMPTSNGSELEVRIDDDHATYWMRITATD